MALRMSRFASALALAALVSTAATPAMARDRWHGHRDRGIDAGDVLTGVLIIGGIAAIASMASSDKDDDERRARDDDRYRDEYPEDRGYYDERYQSNSIDGAVSRCVEEVDRGNEQVLSVDNAARTSEGWEISGRLSTHDGFSCRIDESGRIRSIDIGGYYEGADARVDTDAQWDDTDYAEARARVRDEDRYADRDYDDYSEIDGDLAYEDY